MKIILYDMKLCKLLEKLEDLSINSIQFRPKIINRCKKCILCNLEENIIKISNLICNILKFNIKNLIIYLKFDKFQFLQSTITLNYIKSLYSSILTQYLLLYNKFDIMNNEKLDVIIIPINEIKTEEIKVIEVNNITEFEDLNNTFLYINNPFLYYPFYSSDSFEFDNTHFDLNSICHDNFNYSNIWIKTYHNIMFCGTFDYLHFGHKLLLLAAYLSCEKKLCIGVSTGDLLKNKSNSHKIQHISKRISYLNYYLNLLINNINITHAESTGIQDTEDINGISIDGILDYNIDFNIFDNCDQFENEFKEIPKNLNLEINPKIDPIGDKIDPIGDKIDPIGDKIDPIGYKIDPIGDKIDPIGDKIDPIRDKIDPIRYKIDPIGYKIDPIGYKIDLDQSNISIDLEIFELEDVIGPSCEIKEKFGLLVTPEIMNNALKINQQRKQINLIQWDLITIGLVCYYFNNNLIKLSSTTIRNL